MGGIAGRGLERPRSRYLSIDVDDSEDPATAVPEREAERWVP